MFQNITSCDQNSFGFEECIFLYLSILFYKWLPVWYWASHLAPLSLFTPCERKIKKENRPIPILHNCDLWIVMIHVCKVFWKLLFLAKDVIYSQEMISPCRRIDSLCRDCIMWLHRPSPQLIGSGVHLLFWEFELRDLEPESSQLYRSRKFLLEAWFYFLPPVSTSYPCILIINLPFLKFYWVGFYFWQPNNPKTILYKSLHPFLEHLQ